MTANADEEYEAAKKRLRDFKKKIGIADDEGEVKKNGNVTLHTDCTLKGPKSLYLNCHPLSIPGSCSPVAKTTGAQLPGSESSKPSLGKRVDKDIGESLQTDHDSNSAKMGVPVP